MKYRTNILAKMLFASLLVSSVIYADTYTEHYSVVKGTVIQPNDNFFMNGNFEEIVRFDMINMDSNEKSSQEILNKLIQKTKEYLNNSKDIRVKLVGHTRITTDDMNEKTIEPKSYADKIQNLFRDQFTQKESKEQSLSYAKEISKKLIDSNISKEIIIIEGRGDSDLAFTTATNEGIELSNRVMATIYVLKKKESKKVIKKEPLDSDGDGVYDFKDQCPHTAKNLAVDEYGCPFIQVLHLNFKPSSAKIEKESFDKVKKFATFLKEHPMYKAEIIGHTDNIGSLESNMDLSNRRALSVKNALIKEGVKATRLSSFGRGELDPIATNKSAEGRLQNRRTEIILAH
jgi:outer membrane protein OmpA-like peptidoglycan-associated protein